jgi:hypothetical protein
MLDEAILAVVRLFVPVVMLPGSGGTEAGAARQQEFLSRQLTTRVLFSVHV